MKSLLKLFVIVILVSVVFYGKPAAAQSSTTTEAKNEAEQNKWQEALKIYAGPHIADLVNKSEKVPVENNEIVFKGTVVFIDNKGFQSVPTCSEKTVIEGQRQLMRIIFEAIENNGGFVHQQMGDCVIAIFGWNQSADHAENAMTCYKQVKKELADFNKKYMAAGIPEIRLATSMDCGNIVTLISGTPNRQYCSFLGLPTQTAASLQADCCESEHSIMVSHRIHAAVSEGLQKELVEVAKRFETGEIEPLPVYTLP